MARLNAYSLFIVIILSGVLGAGCAADAGEGLPKTGSVVEEEKIGKTQQALSGLDGNRYVNFHRDRLLDEYASSHGLGNRVNAWSSWSSKQKTLFLLHTDLLGNRSYMSNLAINIRKNEIYDGCYSGPLNDGECNGSCQVRGEWYGECRWINGWECAHPYDGTSPRCYETVAPRSDFSMALEHVTRLYEVLGGSGSCSGEDDNRTFWNVDDPLIQGLRNNYAGLPEWGNGADKPHAPFTNVTETETGSPLWNDGPDGQIQFYSWDWEGRGFARGGRWLPPDARMIELDNDYNTLHDSSPDCSYLGRSGVDRYVSKWQSKGNGQSVDLWYQPTPVCTPSTCAGRCGTQWDGCSQYLSCGACGGGGGSTATLCFGPYGQTGCWRGSGALWCYAFTGAGYSFVPCP
ncbi:MAG: hypothetical protein ABI175_25975 [Polyangiales bacterium]